MGPAAAWADTTAQGDFRIEVLAALRGRAVTLRVLHLGAALPAATIRAVPPVGEDLTLTTDAEGRAVWPLNAAGTHACYVGTTIREPGENDGKAYQSLKDYTTLTFVIEESELADPPRQQ